MNTMKTEQNNKAMNKGSGGGGLGPSGGADDPLARNLPTLSDAAKQKAIQESKESFHNRRRIQISAVPVGTSPEVLLVTNNI